MWVVFALLTSLSESVKDVLGKSSTTKTNVIITAFSVQFFGLLLLIPLVLLTGIPELKPSYWVAVLVGVFFIPAANILYMRAIKLAPLSVSVPMLSFNPIFTAFFSLIFDKRLPEAFGWLGIVCVCTGLYLSRLESNTTGRGLLYPILSVIHEPGPLSMLGVAFIWSIGAHVSKMVTTGSSPVFGAMSYGIVGSGTLAILGIASGKFDVKMIRTHIKQLSILGLFNGVSEIAMNSALAIGFTPYVISIKRTNILWSSLLGRFLYKDRFNSYKLFGLLLMFLGVVLIII